MIWPQKPIFLKGAHGSSSIIGTSTRYGLEILHKCGKGVETKSQKVFFVFGRGASGRGGGRVERYFPYLQKLHGRSYMGKTGRVKVKRAQEARVNQFLFQNVQNNEIFEMSKMFKGNRWINVYYTKSKRL